MGRYRVELGYEAIGLCPVCAKDVPAYYESIPEGIFFVGECPEHGIFREMAEKDLDFFRRGYEHEYLPVRGNLLLPVTYRCNLKCTYCYALSNTDHDIPDRPFEVIRDMIATADGNATLIGGEPTVRDDLFDIIAAARQMSNVNKICVCTNGQRFRDMEYLKGLRAAGLDYLFFSFNDVEYEMSSTVHKNKLQALENCYKLRIPVWLQATISDLRQLDSFVSVLRGYKKIVFNVTVRAVKSIGVNHPTNNICMSEILEYLGKKDDYRMGTNAFNRHTDLEGKNAKICSVVYDMTSLDPVDWDYVISDDTFTKFWRGMRVDEVMLRERILKKNGQSKQPVG